MKTGLLKFAAFTLALAFGGSGAFAGSVDRVGLKEELDRLTAGFNGRVGVAVQDASGSICLRCDERFALQSVIKLFVGIAVMDAADNRGWRLDEQILVRKQDLSLYVQPIAKQVGEHGFRTTVGDLVRGAIVDSDSAATDILIRKLGGPDKVQAVLNAKSLRGVRIDRDERNLQTEIVGLRWRPEYVDAEVLDRAIQGVPKATREAEHRRYLTDPRDTATPRGMAALLQALAEGKLLSSRSTAYLMGVMKETATFPDRLKAGMAAGWTLAHKTGTGGTWNGLTAATNDVGVAIAPDGGLVSLVVFVGDSKAPPEQRAALMAKIAAAAIARYR